jgi:hypothetical protein
MTTSGFCKADDYRRLGSGVIGLKQDGPYDSGKGKPCAVGAW